MGFNLKGIFFATDESETEKKETGQEQANQQQSGSVATATATGIASGTPQPNVNAKENEQIRDSLLGAIEEANLPGFDYFEFAKAVQGQKQPVESERFKSAFITAETMGITSESLVTTAKHYLGVLQKKEGEFQEFINGETEQNVTAVEQEIVQIDAQVTEKSQQIESLNEEINQLREKNKGLTDNVGQAKIRIQQLNNEFAVTSKTIANRIEGDIEKIDKYLGQSIQEDTDAKSK